MSLVKLDLSKLFDLQVLVVESEQELLHLIKQMLLSLGIRKINSARSIDDLLENNEKLPYDVIFLDYAIDDNMNGAEIVEAMIAAGVLPNRTRLILMAEQNDRAQYAIEYPYHQVEYLARPFNKQHIDQQLKQHVMFSQLLKPILALAGLQRFHDALKILLHTQQQKLPVGLGQYLQKLKVQLLLDLGKFELVLPLLKSALAEQQGWALWALFRIRYEKGDIAGCEAFLQDGSQELAKYAENGGNLVLSCRTGLQDKNGHLWEAKFYEPMWKLFGAEVKSYDLPMPHAPVMVNFENREIPWTSWGDLLSPFAGTETWATYEKEFSVPAEGLAKGTKAFVVFEDIQARRKCSISVNRLYQ